MSYAQTGMERGMSLGSLEGGLVWGGVARDEKGNGWVERERDV